MRRSAYARDIGHYGFGGLPYKLFQDIHTRNHTSGPVHKQNDTRYAVVGHRGGNISLQPVGLPAIQHAFTGKHHYRSLREGGVIQFPSAGYIRDGGIGLYTLGPQILFHRRQVAVFQTGQQNGKELVVSPFLNGPLIEKKLLNLIHGFFFNAKETFCKSFRKDCDRPRYKPAYRITCTGICPKQWKK